MLLLITYPIRGQKAKFASVSSSRLFSCQELLIIQLRTDKIAWFFVFMTFFYFIRITSKIDE